MRRVLVVVVGAVVMVGCAESGSSSVSVVKRMSDDATSTTVAPPSTATSKPALTSVPISVLTVDGLSFDIEQIGLSFVLDESFGVLDDPTYLFFARSASPPALITIVNAGDDIADYDPRPGETVTDLDLGAAKAVVVTDAALDGLPEGISANELLVSNGSHSFSVIMSGASTALPELWATFVGSLMVVPQG